MALLNKEEIKIFYEVWKTQDDIQIQNTLHELLFPGITKMRLDNKNHRWVKSIKKRLQNKER